MPPFEFEVLPLVLSVLALAFGGILKGATGAGVPILAVPVIGLYYDVRTAVIVMLLPSLLANVLQAWRFRAFLKEVRFSYGFAVAGMLGAAIGTVLLANVSARYLLTTVAILVLIYVVFRVFWPGWRMATDTAQRLAVPAGLAAGTLQGATGVSAPISLTFLNASGLARPVFIAVVSTYFVTSTSVQIAGLTAFGLLSWHGLALSAGALVLILIMMPVGEAIGRRLSGTFFDRLILFLLTGIALRILLAPLFELA